MYKSPSIVAPPSLCKILVSIYSEDAFHGKTNFLKTSELTFSSPKSCVNSDGSKERRIPFILIQKVVFQSSSFISGKNGDKFWVSLFAGPESGVTWAPVVHRDLLRKVPSASAHAAPFHKLITTSKASALHSSSKWSYHSCNRYLKATDHVPLRLQH